MDISNISIYNVCMLAVMLISNSNLNKAFLTNRLCFYPTGENRHQPIHSTELSSRAFCLLYVLPYHHTPILPYCNATIPSYCHTYSYSYYHTLLPPLQIYSYSYSISAIPHTWTLQTWITTKVIGDMLLYQLILLKTHNLNATSNSPIPHRAIATIPPIVSPVLDYTP